MSLPKKAVIFNDTSHDYHLGCELVINNLTNLLKKNNITVIGKSKVGECWFENQDILNKIDTADLLIVNGEGTIHNTTMNAIWLLKVSEYAKKRNKKSVLINSVYENNNISLKKYMDCFDLISVRESLSYKELNSINVESQVVPDLTFYSNFLTNNPLQNNEHILFGDCVKIKQSNLNLIQSRIYNKSSFLSVLKSSVIKFNSLNPVHILKFIKNKFFFILRSFIFKLNKDSFINTYQYRYYGASNIEEYIRKLNNSKIHISGRFHSICFSILSQTPFLAQKSNTHKIQALLNDIGLAHRLIDSEKLSLDLINHNSIFNKSEKDKINLYCKEAKTKIDNLFNKIANL